MMIVALAFLAIQTLIIAGCLWGAARILARVSSFYLRALLGAVFCLAPLAVGAYFARQDLGSDTRRGLMGLDVFFLWPAGLATLAFLASARTRRVSLFGVVSMALAGSAFMLGGPLWMEFAPPPDLFQEPHVVNDVRTVLSAQVAYASFNDGAYGRLPCLAAPRECGFPAGTSPFLDVQQASLHTRHGYRRIFIPGDVKRGAPDANGLSTFAYVAVPLERGRTGARGFCGDDSGRICATADGSAPLVTGGRCPPACSDLQ